MKHFPPLRLAVLQALVDIKANLDRLDESEYDEETKKVLRDLLAPREIEVPVERVVEVRGRGRPGKDVALSEEAKEKLDKTIIDLLTALENMGTGEGLETNERVQITKTQASLVRDLLQMRERNTTAQRMEEFMENVINILNDLVSEEDRDEFLRRLESFRS